MQIQPGFEAPSVANMVELIRKDSLRRVNIELVDKTGAPVDIDTSVDASGEPRGELELVVTNVGGSPIYTEDYRIPAQVADPRIKRTDTGKFYIKWGVSEYETDRPGTVVFNWHSRQDETAEDVYRSQVAEVVTVRTLSLLPVFRLLIDKVLKQNLPEELCFTGYTDGMLALWLKQGLHYINSFQPYPVWISIDSFPIETHSDILIRSAMYVALTSQMLFAVDTDVPNYSDSGHSFVLQHQQPLAAYIANLQQELMQLIPSFKRQFVSSGTVSIEMRLDMAFAMMLSSAPNGTLFRNLWQGGAGG